MENVVAKLHDCGASQEVLYSFLLLIDSEEKRLAVARMVNCDKAIVEVRFFQTFLEYLCK